jgi:hypothetical protein
MKRHVVALSLYAPVILNSPVLAAPGPETASTATSQRNADVDLPQATALPIAYSAPKEPDNAAAPSAMRNPTPAPRESLSVHAQADAPAANSEPTIPRSSTRNGFYLRVNSSAGYATVAGDGPSGRASISGLGSGVQLAIGGTVTRGLVLAGSLQATNTKATFEGGPFDHTTLTLGDRRINVSPKVDAMVSQLGALADYYFGQSLGWHVGISGGWSIISIVNRADESMYYGSGVSGTVFTGYDWPMWEKWSMGLTLFGCGSTTANIKEAERGTDTRYRFHSLSIGIAASLLYF